MAQIDPWEAAPPVSGSQVDPWEVAAPTDTAAHDILTRTLPAAAYHTATGLATMPGNVDQLLSDLSNWVNRQRGLPETPRLFGPQGGIGRMMPGEGGLLPTQSDLEGQLQSDTGRKVVEPTTPAGQAIEKPAEMVMGALTMPANGVKEVAGNLLKYAATPLGVGAAAKTGAALVGASPGAQATAEDIGQLAGSGMGILKDRPGAVPMNTVEDVKSGVDAFYSAARAKGVVYSPTYYTKMANDIGAEAARMKVNPVNFPGSSAVLAEMDKMVGAAPDVEELDLLRQQIGGVMRDGTLNDKRIAGMIKRKLDGYVNDATPADVMAGDPTGVGDLLKQGRDLRVQQSKMETIQEAYRNAELSRVGQTDMDTALSNEFRKIAKSDDFKYFTPEEKAAIDDVVLKSKTEKAGAFLEQFADPRKPRTALIGAGVGAGAALGAGIPWQIGAAAVPAIGMAGRAIAQGVTERQAKLAADLIAGGSMRPPWDAARRGIVPLSIPLANMATTPPSP